MRSAELLHFFTLNVYQIAYTLKCRIWTWKRISLQPTADLDYSLKDGIEV